MDEVFICVYQSRDNSSLIDVIKLKNRKMKMSLESTDMYLMTELETTQNALTKDPEFMVKMYGDKPVIKCGELRKRSRFLKAWRLRWFELTCTHFRSFANILSTGFPTEEIPLQNCKSVKPYELEGRENVFCMEVIEGSRGNIISFLLQAENEKDMK